MIFRAIKKVFLAILAVVGLLFLFLLGHLGYNFFTGNVHLVVPGKVYRTAQLDHAGLKKYTKLYGIKTIVNLRGAWKTNHWYQVESRFVKKHRIAYYSPQFSAYILPSKKALLDLVRVIETAPKPMMVHCEGGADRAGMASAISVILFNDHVALKQIERQVSWHYNAISNRSVGHQLLKNYFAWLKQHHYKTSTKKRFVDFLKSPDKMKPYYGWFWV